MSIEKSKEMNSRLSKSLELFKIICIQLYEEIPKYVPYLCHMCESIHTFQDMNTYTENFNNISLSLSFNKTFINIDRNVLT